MCDTKTKRMLLNETASAITTNTVTRTVTTETSTSSAEILTEQLTFRFLLALQHAQRAPVLPIPLIWIVVVPQVAWPRIAISGSWHLHFLRAYESICGKIRYQVKVTSKMCRRDLRARHLPHLTG